MAISADLDVRLFRQSELESLRLLPLVLCHYMHHGLQFLLLQVEQISVDLLHLIL